MENRGLRRGRPPKDGEGKRASFNTRIRAALKQDLEAAAAAHGRSLSEEIEARLEQSMPTAPRTAAILDQFATTVRVLTLSRGSGDAWLDDYEGFHFVRGMLRRHLDKIPSPAMPDEVKKKVHAAKWAIEGIKRTKELQGSRDAIGTARIAAHYMVSTLLVDDETRDELTKLLAEAEREE